jgi:hypothetical protein
MWFDDAVMDDDERVGDWLTRTGKSFFKVNWGMAKEYQKFWLWTPDGENDLGDKEWDGRSPDEMWLSLSHKNSGLGELRDFRLFDEQRVLFWKDLPALKVTAVPKVIPSRDRGIEVRLMDLNSAPRPRSVGHLVRVTWQLFTRDKKEHGAGIEVDVPNEITLAQLRAAYIFPFMEGRFDRNTVFSWCLEEREDSSKKDKTKSESVQIQQVLPIGFNLRVKASTLHNGDSGKHLVELMFESVRLHFAMPVRSTLENLSAPLRRECSSPDTVTSGFLKEIRRKK